MSVYKDGSKWRVIYRYTDSRGERKQTQKRGFSTKKEALAWEREQMNKTESSLDMTFESFSEIYFEDMKKRLKDNTWHTKEHILRTKLIPFFGKRKMCDIQPKDVIIMIIRSKWRKEMKGLDWGRLYHEHKSDVFDPAALETKITALMADKEVTKNSGIYEYLLTGKEKYLSLRQFDEEYARTAYEQQQGICPICKKHFDFDKMHADHITPWHAGGKTVPENLQMLCRDCNLKKSGQE